MKTSGNEKSRCYDCSQEVKSLPRHMMDNVKTQECIQTLLPLVSPRALSSLNLNIVNLLN